MTERVRTARCACGQLSLEARGEPDRVGACHCMTCRKTTGSVLSVFAIYPRSRVAIAGRYEGWAPVDDGRRCFCPVCGSRVFELSADEVEVMAGAFDEPNAVRPTYETWAVRREHWLPAFGILTYPHNRSDR